MTPPLHRAAAVLQQHWWRPRPSALALALLPLAGLYGLAATLNRWRWQWRGPAALPVPVLVVGNLIVGGAGKTPTTIALVQWLKTHGLRPGIISRGYGRQSESLCLVDATTPAERCGDEPLLMHLRTGVPTAVGADRVAAGLALLAAHPELNLIIADDGLQHWRLQRQWAVLVFDARGAGNGLLLPAGPLRQALPSHLPASQWVIYNADAASTHLPGGCARRGLGGAIPLTAWWQGEPASAAHFQDLREAALRHAPLAVAGIAQPGRFFDMLRGQGLPVREWPLADHAPLLPLPWPAHEPMVLVTEKDAVKLRPDALPAGVAERTWVITLDFELPATLTDALGPALRPLLAFS